MILSRAGSKAFVASQINIDPRNLPYNESVIDVIKNYKSNGFKIFLCTGASEDYAKSISKYLGFFDNVFYSSKTRNNVGINKLQLLKENFKDFIYIGDSVNDIPIWDYCKKAIIVSPTYKIKKFFDANEVEVINSISLEKNYFFFTT